MTEKDYISSEDQGQEKFLNKKIRDTDLYKVPEGYFEELPNQVIKKIKSENASVRRLPARWIYSAAAILLILITVSLVFLLDNKSAEFDDNLLIGADYLPELYIDEMSEALIYEALSQSDNDNLLNNLSDGLVTGSDTSISEDDILNYLLEEGFTENDLLIF
jgi:hypothetical protein